MAQQLLRIPQREKRRPRDTSLREEIMIQGKKRAVRNNTELTLIDIKKIIHTRRIVTLLEILDSRGEPRERNLIGLMNIAMMMMNTHQAEDLGLKDIEIRDGMSQEHIMTQDLGVEGMMIPPTTTCNCFGSTASSRKGHANTAAAMSTIGTAIATTCVSTTMPGDASSTKTTSATTNGATRARAAAMVPQAQPQTALEQSQAFHIQQLQHQMMQLQRQIAAAAQQPTQPRPHSQPQQGTWGWRDSQAQSDQWHSHGWQNWGNDRGYQ